MLSLTQCSRDGQARRKAEMRFSLTTRKAEMRFSLTAALLSALLLSVTHSFQQHRGQPTSHKPKLGAADDYAQRWDALVLEEYRATAN